MKKYLHGKAAPLGIVSFACALILLNSCLKDNFELSTLKKPEWNPDLGVPLINTSLELGDLLSSSNDLIQIDSENFMSLVFGGATRSLSADSIYPIKNQTFSESNELTAAEATAINLIAGSGNSYSYTRSTLIDFDFGDVSLDSILFKGGNLSLNFSSDIPRTIQMTFSMPEAKKNGASLSQVVNLNYTGSVPITQSVSIDLSGYVFDFATQGQNQLSVNITTTLNDGATFVNSGDAIDVTQSLTAMKFSKIFGAFGQLNIPIGADTIDLSLFKNLKDIGSFMLANPIMNINVGNSLGIPFNLFFKEFSGISSSGTSLPIIGNEVTQIGNPTINQQGQLIVSQLKLDTANSNLASVFNIGPSSFVYNAIVQSNPSGVSGVKNYILDTSKVEFDIDFEMPFYGRATDFVIQDTFELKFEKVDQIESLLMRLDINNGFPMDVGLQLYLVDSTFNKLDSLLPAGNTLMASAVVSNSTGKVTSSTQKTTDIVLNESQIAKLKNTKNIIVSGSLATYLNGSVDVKIYSDYKLDLKLGAQVKLKVKLDELGNKDKK